MLWRQLTFWQAGTPPRALRGIATLALVCATAAGCSSPDGAEASGADGTTSVQIERVREEPVRRAIEVVGTLAAEDEVTISAEAEGRVTRVLADLGDRVRAGQVLIEIDREKLEYSLEQQRAALAQALARYGAADPEHLPAIEQTPGVERAQAELAQAKQAFERAEELNRRQLVPRQALEDAETTLRTKEAGYKSALQAAKNLRAEIDAWTATAELAGRQLRDSSIRAPFDGYIQKRLVALGEYVKLQAPVMTVVRIATLKVTGEFPEKLSPWVTVGQPVELDVDAYPDRRIAGKVSRISPAVNPATRAFPFEALVPNGDAQLKPGMFARVRIESSRVDRVLTLSPAALQYRYGVNRAFVVTGDRLSARELKVGERIGDRVEILEGVGPGEPVAVTDIDKLTDGMKVSVRANSE